MEANLAQAEYDEARANLARARTRVELGRILKVVAHDGEVVTDRGVVEMGRTDAMVAIAKVYEPDIRYVHPGRTPERSPGPSSAKSPDASPPRSRASPSSTSSC